MKKKHEKAKKSSKSKSKITSNTASKELELESAYKELEDEHQAKKVERPAIKRKETSTLSFQEKCDLIAELSESALEDPEQAFAATEITIDEGENHRSVRKGPSKIQQLLTLAGQQKMENEQYTAQLAIMSLLAVFKDIVPSYRIRLPTAKELAVKVSKETKKLWDYERALLQHYQSYLQLLEKTWERGKQKTEVNSVAVTAILSMAELLKTCFHFNFRSNLLTAVVREMNYSRSEAVSTACCESVEFVFTNDAQGDVALEATRQVAKAVKDRRLRVEPKVLRTFLALPLRVHVDEAQAAKLAAEANAKKRKRDKEIAEIESELRESQATVDKIVLARSQSEILQAVTLTYFRVLKSENLKAFYVEKLLPPALEGLAKFAHLINIETVMDLLAVLRELLKRLEDLPLDAALNCVLTAFQTLQGPGKELKIDQKEYIMPLYNLLPRLCTEEHSKLHTDLVIQCLTAAFVKRREFSTIRIAAFLKQILTTSMHTSAHTSVPLISFARHLLQRYPSAEQMLENEQDVITSGQYTPDVEDPEHSNPFATSAWEVATLQFHIHPAISEQGSAAASMKMLQLPAETPEKLRSLLMNDMHELYIPFKRIKKKHPLESRQASTENIKKKSQIRFIKPRTTQCKIVKA